MSIEAGLLQKMANNISPSIKLAGCLESSILRCNESTLNHYRSDKTNKFIEYVDETLGNVDSFHLERTSGELPYEIAFKWGKDTLEVCKPLQSKLNK